MRDVRMHNDSEHMKKHGMKSIMIAQHSRSEIPNLET